MANTSLVPGEAMKISLGKKLGVGFGVVLALMMLNSILVYMKASAIKESQDRALNVRVPTIQAVEAVQRDLNQTQSKGRQAILAGAEPDRREVAKRGFDEAWGEIEKDVARLDVLSRNWTAQANRDRLDDLKKQLPELRQAQEQIINHAASGEHDAVLKAGNDFTDKATVITESLKKPLGEMMDSIVLLLKQNTDDMAAETSSMYLTMAVTSLAALGVGLFLAVSLSRSIAGATQSVLAQTEAIAAGDLTLDDLTIRSQDELGDLTAAINKMSGSLKHIILAITENSLQVATASETLSTTSQQITANSEETSAQAKVVSNATQQVSQNMHTVATGADEMGVS